MFVELTWEDTMKIYPELKRLKVLSLVSAPVCSLHINNDKAAKTPKVLTIHYIPKTSFLIFKTDLTVRML